MSHRFLWVSLLLSCIHTCHGLDLTYNVQEGKSPGTYIGDLAADLHLRDRIESRADGQIMFSLLKKSGASNSQLFRISRHTGKLFTAQTLDAESVCVYNTECFKMVDIVVQRANSFMKILKIKVVIDDVNDHPPEFPYKEIRVQYSEGDGRGMRKLIPHAIDRDVSVLNSRITYELKKNKNNPFTLSVSKRLDGTSQLGINLEEKLDRETKDSYTIQVVARDGGSPPKESILDVYISVTDVNDNTPVFSQDVYNFSVKNEVLRAAPVTILSATDMDSGKNGKITYHFSSRTSKVAKSHFKLNEVTGEIFLQKKFMTGEKLTHKLFVEATDGGSPPLTSIAKVLVNVININNSPPNIDVSFFSASTENAAAISEEISVGSFIAYVIVTDHDVGQNGEVTCSLQHEKFLLENLGLKEYKITIKNPLDREIQDRHDLMIRCQDKAMPPLHSESKFSIRVIDANDERPRFTKEVFKFWINENQKSKLAVGSIRATDPDLGAGSQLSYSLLTNDEHFLPFQISENGLISTVISLDHEFQDLYEFQVLVKDNGIPSLNNSVKVVVEVKDKNDNVPYFTFPSVNPYTMDVVYYPQHTNNITVLRAADSDSHENSFLKYEIRGGNDKQLFAINHYTGLLSFARVATQQDAGTYDLEFVVKDSGNPVLSASTTLFLKLTVSNQTSTALNAVNIQSDNKIRLYLLIVTVLVAVTVSIPLTAAISICIIRCIDKRNTARSGQLDSTNKCPTSDDTHSICSSYQARYWSGVSVAVTSDQDTVSRTLPAKMKKGQQQQHQQKQQKQQQQKQQQQSGNSIKKDRSSSLGIKVQTATEVLYEYGSPKTSSSQIVRVQKKEGRFAEIGGKCGLGEHKDGAFILPSGHTNPLASIHSSREDILPKAYGKQYKEQTDVNSSQALVSCQNQSTDMRPSLKTFMSPGKTRTAPRCLYPTNLQPMVNYKQWTTLKPNSMENRGPSDALAKQGNLTDIVRLTYSPKSVPKITQGLTSSECVERMKGISTIADAGSGKAVMHESALKSSPSPPQSVTHT